MRDQDLPKEKPPPKAPSTQRDRPAPNDDGYDDEEKLLAGNQDVNMPALLTRDVKGG